jgi:hypothetical protein
LRDGFADAAEEALLTLKQMETALAEAKERRAALAAKIDALAPTEAIMAAEASIRAWGPGPMPILRQCFRHRTQSNACKSLRHRVSNGARG